MRPAQKGTEQSAAIERGKGRITWIALSPGMRTPHKVTVPSFFKREACSGRNVVYFEAMESFDLINI